MKEEVDVHYRLTGKNEIGVEAQSYNPKQGLMIDPVLIYSTVFGGSGVTFQGDPTFGNGSFKDEGDSIALDSRGNAYVIGITYSADFAPLNSSLTQGKYSDEFNCFVAKLNPAGVLLYVSFLAGTGVYCRGAVDGNGNAFVAATSTFPDFPVANALQPLPAGGNDATISKLSPDGASLLFSTYLGGSNDDLADAIALDAIGNAYITGSTKSVNFPLTAGAVHLASSNIAGGLFISKISGDGTTLMYSSLLAGSSGGNGYSVPTAIAVDVAGRAVVTGSTGDSDFPTTRGALQGDRPGAVLFRLNAAGSGLDYSGYLFSPNYAEAGAIAVDSSGNVYLAGSVFYPGFPTTPGAFETTAVFDPEPGLQHKGFVSKVNSTGSAFVYSSYLGGSSIDAATGIAVDTSGNAYIVGSTNSNDFPLVRPMQAILPGGGHRCVGYAPNAQGPVIGCSDAFITKLSPDGSSAIYSSYLGGSQNDFATSIAISAGMVYISGLANSPDIPITTSSQRPKGTVWVAAISETADLPAASFVGSAASYVTGLTPGGIATIFGYALTSSSGLLTAPGFPLPLTLGGTSIAVNGISAPLLAVGNAGSQVNFVVPWEVGNAATAAIVITNNNLSSISMSVPLLTYEPGIFTIDGTHAAAQHSSDYTLVTAASPAIPGEVIVLYATGLGPVSPSVASGTPALSNPLSRTIDQATVTVANASAQILFSGLTPGSFGLYQLNLQLPMNAAPGEATVSLSIGGQVSAPAKLFIQ
jgi:uncharacterized protein (TIGR03437 family)